MQARSAGHTHCIELPHLGGEFCGVSRDALIGIWLDHSWPVGLNCVPRSEHCFIERLFNSVRFGNHRNLDALLQALRDILSALAVHARALFQA